MVKLAIYCSYNQVQRRHRHSSKTINITLVQNSTQNVMHDLTSEDVWKIITHCK